MLRRFDEEVVLILAVKGLGIGEMFNGRDSV